MKINGHDLPVIVKKMFFATIIPGNCKIYHFGEELVLNHADFDTHAKLWQFTLSDSVGTVIQGILNEGMLFSDYFTDESGGVFTDAFSARLEEIGGSKSLKRANIVIEIREV